MGSVDILEYFSALFVCIAMVGQYLEKSQSKASKRLLFCSAFTFFTLLIDGLSYTLPATSFHPFLLVYIITLFSYLAGTGLIVAFLFYCEAYIEEKTSLNKWTFRIPRIAMYFSLILISVYYFMGKVAIFENGLYVGDADIPFVVSILQVLVLIYTPIIAFLKRNEIGLKAMFSLGFFNFAPIIAIVISLWIPVDLSLVFGGLAICIIVTFLQTSERQEAMEETLKLAQDANKAKTNFLFNMSHDIRTPMNAIIGFTSISLKNLDDKEKLEENLKKTQQAGDLLLTLINSILDMSRIESGKVKLEESVGDVCYSFTNVESTLKELAEAKDIDLSFEIEDVRDRYVYADYERCARIFVNIITNAIKYTQSGGYVKVKCKQLGEVKDGYGTYQYTFEDNGIGMSKEFQSHIFEEFAREDNSTISGIQGTGLGLAVTKSFVNLMNGSIDFVSEQGKGTTFTVTLPFRIQDESEHDAFVDPETGEIVHANEIKEEQFDFEGKKVLLVEDNDLNKEIAQEILEDEGIVVETASDGSIAVKMMRENGPDYYDFILMDIQMPIMGGYEATKEIRKMYPDADIPIIAVSANAFEEDRKASQEAGMNDHIAKPINIKGLFTTLAKYQK